MLVSRPCLPSDYGAPKRRAERFSERTRSQRRLATKRSSRIFNSATLRRRWQRGRNNSCGWRNTECYAVHAACLRPRIPDCIWAASAGFRRDESGADGASVEQRQPTNKWYLRRRWYQRKSWCRCCREKGRRKGPWPGRCLLPVRPSGYM